MQKDCLAITQVQGGINFQYEERNKAQELSEFIKDNLSCRTKMTQQLISHNEQNSEYNYKYTYIVELAPVCRDDLVMLPKNVQREYGGIGPLVLVYKISKFIHIVDINTMQTYEVDRENYWKHPFKAIMGRERLTEFIVIDIENIDTNFNDSRAALK
jgi:nonsense-mediated mRNA decay protein 3